MNTQKPFAESCVQNQQVILDVLLPLLKDKTHLLEIGSGTGQHAVFFAKHMPHLIWQTSDQAIYHEGIKRWLDEAALDNTREPLVLNCSIDPWPKRTFDAIFSANVVHIMSWENVVDYFKHACPRLETKGYFILYGPFNYNGQYTSESNARFDQWLKNNDPKSCIKDFEKLNKLAQKGDMQFFDDIAMPANNRILIWQKN
ncbi:MAG: methylase [Thiotrichales bacterium]|nr:MAG: methylase [Thiotrichales bacterium]